MINIVKNVDIFDTDSEALVNPVNCVGVMGKGLALEFKKRFPDNFERYKYYCDKNLLFPGTIFVFKNKNPPKYIINFPTKNHWREKSNIEYIIKGLDKLKSAVYSLNIKSISIPKIGCGLGGLNWEEEVKPIILEKLNDISNEIKITITE